MAIASLRPAELSVRDRALPTVLAFVIDAEWKAHIEQQLQGSVNDDPNPFFGRVLYTPGLVTDQPLSTVRIDYADATNLLTGASRPYLLEPPEEVVPIWNSLNQYDNVLVTCVPNVSPARCPNPYPQTNVQMYYLLPDIVTGWYGSLLQYSSDDAGTNYRRARTYDPSRAKFMQEDPLGLAGGLSSYGFANGDPVNYTDPFGLCPKEFRGNCTQADVPPQAPIFTIGSSGAIAVGPGVHGSAALSVNTVTGEANFTVSGGGSLGVGASASYVQANVQRGKLPTAGSHSGSSPNIELEVSSPVLSLSQSFDTSRNWALTGNPTIGYGPTKFGAGVFLNAVGADASYTSRSFNVFQMAMDALTAFGH
jgi:RHS repeat-associated protein